MWLKKREVGAFGLDSRKKGGKGGKRSSRVPTARAGLPLWRRARARRRGAGKDAQPRPVMKTRTFFISGSGSPLQGFRHDFLPAPRPT